MEFPRVSTCLPKLLTVCHRLESLVATHLKSSTGFLSSNDKDPNYLRYTGVRLKSAGGPHASDWLLQPQPPHYALSELEMDSASRLRLGDPLCPPDTQCPKCNKPLSSPGDSFHHLCLCPHVRQPVILRHELIKGALNASIKDVTGLQTELEPYDRQKE